MPLLLLNVSFIEGKEIRNKNSCWRSCRTQHILKAYSIRDNFDKIKMKQQILFNCKKNPDSPIKYRASGRQKKCTSQLYQHLQQYDFIYIKFSSLCPIMSLTGFGCWIFIQKGD